MSEQVGKLSRLKKHPGHMERAKIPNAGKLIKASHKSPIDVKAGAIIDFCNQHVINSLQKYDLTEIDIVV